MRRVFCSQECSIHFIASQPRSKLHIQRVADARKRFNQTDAGKAVLAGSSQKYKTWLKTDSGKRHLESNSKSHSEWLKTDAGIEWRKRVNAMRTTPEYSAKISASRKAFLASDKGLELRKQFSDMYTGIPRPPEVTEKMKASLEAFWNSPEGVYRAAEISARKTDNIPDAPYGPNWHRQRRKTIERDQFTCQIGGSVHLGNSSELEVHHIYNRRLFGYALGVNDHFRWANHLHNLITLCKSCHTSVENGVAIVPEHFKFQADLHYQQFIMPTRH